MPIVYHKDVPAEPFSGGATYQTLVGDQEGSTPVRVGIQVSPPGYKHADAFTPLPRGGNDSGGDWRGMDRRARRHYADRPRHDDGISTQCAALVS